MKTNTLLVIGAAFVAYLLLRPKGESPAYLEGVGANKILSDAQSAMSTDPNVLDARLSRLSADTKQLTASLRDNPQLGIALGLTPTQVDYAILPPNQFRTIYGFSQPAEPTGPAA